MTLKTLRAEFLVEHLNLPAAAQVENARWEHFQLAHLNDDSTLRIENKSRQIAWSFTIAAEAVAEAVLDGRSSVFVSINQDEAKEKIRYARQVYRNLENIRLPALRRDNDLMLEFATSDGSEGPRIISFPSKAPRGKPRFNVYLDEFAHVQGDRAIYTGAMPIISKGGRLRVGSSPMGASGVFWEIFTQAMQPYPGYARKQTPWWEVQAFCKNVREARRLAPNLPTRQRVELFGTDAIKAIFGNMPLEDFQQEYECQFIDESTAWITWAEIKANQDAALTCVIVDIKGDDVSRALEAIDRLAGMVKRGEVEQVLTAGFDVGRTRNTSELFITGISTTRRYPLRLAITLDATAFDAQEDVLTYALRRLPLAQLLIDRNGIGRNLAESVSTAYPGKARGVDFTAPSKVLWATDAKMLAQQTRTPLPTDRDIAYQIHSIKRKVTGANNLVFDTEKNEKHHADKFWAWALALAGVMTFEKRRQQQTPGSVSMQTMG